jgi:hypothetical protein
MSERRSTRPESLPQSRAEGDRHVGLTRRVLRFLERAREAPCVLKIERTAGRKLAPLPGLPALLPAGSIGINLAAVLSGRRRRLAARNAIWVELATVLGCDRRRCRLAARNAVRVDDATVLGLEDRDEAPEALKDARQAREGRPGAGLCHSRRHCGKAGEESQQDDGTEGGTLHGTAPFLESDPARPPWPRGRPLEETV